MGPHSTSATVSTMPTNGQSPGAGTPRRRPRWRRCRPRARCRRAPRPRGPGGPPGTPRRRAGRTPRSRALVQSTAGAASGTRSGQARPSAIGISIVGGEAWSERGAVDELDHRVHHRGGVHDDLDAVERDVEEQVRLDHLEALVDQGRGVDRDHRPHGPGRVVQRLLGRDVGEPLAGPAAERAAARGEHQAAYLLGAAAAQALRERAVLAVDRHDLARAGPAR